MTLTALLSALRRYWPYVAIAGLIVALLLTRGTLERRTSERDAERVAHKLTVAEYQRVAAERTASDNANVTRVREETDAISQTTVDDYQARIDQLRRDFAERVRTEAASSASRTAAANLPGVSPATEPASGAPSAPQLSAQDALECSVTAERLVALQAWVKRTAAVDVNGDRSAPATP